MLSGVDSPIRGQEYVLSAVVRRFSDLGSPLDIMTHQIAGIVGSAPIPENPADAIFLILDYIRRLSKSFDSTVDIYPEKDYPEAFSRSPSELDYLIKNAVSDKFINIIDQAPYPLTGRDERKIKVQLAPKGWMAANGMSPANLRNRPSFVQAAVALQGPRFVLPKVQFEKALHFFAQNPPDIENSLKDAVGAVEGVANIIAGVSGQQLDSVIDKLVAENKIQKPDDEIFKKLYARRGAAPGVAHSNVTRAPSLSHIEASFLLGICAECILFLAQL
jgi:transcriptional regulator CtsR